MSRCYTDYSNEEKLFLADRSNNRNMKGRLDAEYLLEEYRNIAKEAIKLLSKNKIKGFSNLEKEYYKIQEYELDL
jgi:hypothetical protein